MGGSQASARILHVLFRLALARFLVPADFGLLAVAVVVTGFADLLRDAGLGPAVVQRPRLADAEASSIFWAVLATSTAAAGLVLAGAPLVGAVFRMPRVVPVLRVLGLNLIIAGPAGFYTSLFERRLAFRTLAARRIAATVAGGTGALVLALAGYGVWALVAGIVIQSILSLLLLAWQARWLPRPRFDAALMMEIWSYARSVIGTRLFTYVSNNADTFLVGRYLGSGPLGFYSLGTQAISLPRQCVSLPLTTVGLALFSAAQDDRARCRRAYQDGLEVVMMGAWPVVALAALAAPVAIPVVLGSRWLPIVPVFQILSGTALVQTLLALSSPLFQGLGRPELGMRWSLVHSSLLVPAVVVGLRWGVVGVATGSLAASLLSLPLNLALSGRLVALPWQWLAKAMARGVAGVVALTLVWTESALWFHGFAPALRLLVSGLVSTLAALVAARVLFPRATRLVADALRGVAGVHLGDSSPPA